jgi:hypothetical protein
MWQALGHVLPIALASALSSIPIMAAILILLSPNKHRSSVPYLIGWALGIAAVVVAFVVLVAAVGEPPRRGPQVGIAIAQIVIGLALVGFAIVLWRRSAGKPAMDEPKWLSAVGSFGPWSSFGLGLALNLRPKSLLLTAAAALPLAGAGLTTGEIAVLVAIYTALSASTVAIPVIATFTSPKKTEEWLVATRAWLARNSLTVTVLTLIIIGVVIIGSGLTRL